MSKHVGDYDPSAVIYGKFGTVRPSTFAPFSLAGGALAVYKDNSSTQTVAGVFLTADFDAVIGLNHWYVDTSADASFYTSGSCFEVVLTAGSVDGVAVREPIASFTMRKAGAIRVQGPVKKNQAVANFPFIMVNSAGTPLTGLTVTVSSSIDGATSFTAIGTATEMSAGWYKRALSAADVNGDVIALRFTATGASDQGVTILTNP